MDSNLGELEKELESEHRTRQDYQHRIREVRALILLCHRVLKTPNYESEQNVQGPFVFNFFWEIHFHPESSRTPRVGAAVAPSA